VICHLYNIWSWKRAHCPYIVHVTSKNVPCIFHLLHKNFSWWKQFKFFILCENLLLRESPLHILNCLKLVNFTLFFVYTLKLLKGPLWHISLFYFEKNMTFARACGFRVVQQLLNKTMQKLSAKVSKRGSATSLKEGGPERTALFTFPNIHPCSQLHKKEKTGFIL